MSVITGTKLCQDVLIHRFMSVSITDRSGVPIPTAFAVSIWGGFVFDKAVNCYLYSRPTLITKIFNDYADKLAIDIYWIAQSAEPVSPPEDVDWELAYGSKAENDTLSSDFTTTIQSPVIALDYTNQILKRTRFDLDSSEFSSKQGNLFTARIGRLSDNILDTYGGNVGYLGMLLVKKGVGE